MDLRQFFSNGFLEKKLELVEQSCDFVLDFKQESGSLKRSQKSLSKKRLHRKTSNEEQEMPVPKPITQFSAPQNTKVSYRPMVQQSLEDDVFQAVSTFGKNVQSMPSPIKKEDESLNFNTDWDFHTKQDSGKNDQKQEPTHLGLDLMKNLDLANTKEGVMEKHEDFEAPFIDKIRGKMFSKLEAKNTTICNQEIDDKKFKQIKKKIMKTNEVTI